jgi:hypothetical protein
LNRFNLSNKVSKANARVTNIPSTVNVLQEDIAKNPKCCRKVSFINIEAITGQLIPWSAAFEAAPAKQVPEPSDTGPRINESGKILISVSPKYTEMGVLKLQGTVIDKSNVVRCLIYSTAGHVLV